MKVNDYINKELGKEVSIDTRTKVVGRLLRVGISAEDEITKVNRTIVADIVKKASASTDPNQQMRTASLSAHMPVMLNHSLCPVCKGAMTQGTLHTGQITQYCPKCRVATSPES